MTQYVERIAILTAAVELKVVKYVKANCSKTCKTVLTLATLYITHVLLKSSDS